MDTEWKEGRQEMNEKKARELRQILRKLNRMDRYKLFKKLFRSLNTHESLLVWGELRRHAAAAGAVHAARVSVGGPENGAQ